MAGVFISLDEYQKMQDDIDRMGAVNVVNSKLLTEYEEDNKRLRAALSFIAMARQPSMGQTWESHAIEIADYAAEKLKEKE